MNQKERHIGKRKASSSARKRLRKLHTSKYENSCFTKKIVLYFKEDTIDSEKLQSVVPSLTSQERTVQATPLKKNLKKGKGKEKKRECEWEGKREGKGEERKERERRKKWRERY